ncbi:D-glycerate dehydrogenase [Virgibacillus profundi]|uniref:D-glycerate dehydrogenase n=1 Tax=Virgibacillus profundi TaxID=2024555 RepID=A0A2A2I9R1_9BACI|nr:D-glycerate dehydrogenase [Virgibacillus profundi]PAV28741.1 D-glycerate dehydrogenase [Virgibacillus profundi]PXY52909.1 D-glycerate dehydrogenase [Virgibacillus profundi]
MSKPIIYITRRIPDEIIEPYRETIDFRMWKKEDQPVPRDILLEEVAQADGLLCMLSDKIDKELLSKASKLKIAANLAVGFDNIDIEAAKQQEIIITNTPDVLTETTADLGFALLMATARRIVEAEKYIQKDQWKNWSPYLLAGTDVHHKTIGIVGMGRIGEAIARRAKGFGMSILYHNRTRKYDSESELGATYVGFDQLLDKADFVVSVVPFTNETNKLFDQSAFSKMKSTAIFINISRGAVVDEDSLLEALKTKQIKAAGLDVFEAEPIRKSHPLLMLDNVVCLPHIGSASEETRTAMLQLCLDNITSVLQGKEPKTAVK